MSDIALAHAHQDHSTSFGVLVTLIVVLGTYLAFELVSSVTQEPVWGILASCTMIFYGLVIIVFALFIVVSTKSWGREHVAELIEGIIYFGLGIALTAVRQSQR